MRTISRLAPSLLLALSCLTLRGAEIAAVNATVFNGYTRAQEADGSFKPEYVVFGEGGCWTRPVDDPAMAKLNFAMIARMVVPPLAKVKYLPAAQGHDASLLILVFWGTTMGSHDYDPNLTVQRATEAVADMNRVQAAGRNIFGEVDGNSPAGSEYENALWLLGVANTERDSLDERNARILGYSESVDRARFIQSMSMGRDVLQEIGGNRHYLVLQAYDYAMVKAHKKLRPLWTTRMSVGESGDLASAINRMAASSTRYFGQNTQGLRRERLPEGKVELGPMRVLGTVSPASASEPEHKP